MSLFFFIQYLFIRRKEHLNYAAYLLLLWLYMFAAMPEYFFSIDLNNTAEVAQYNLYKRPIQYLSSIFYTWFIIYYLGLEKTKNKLFGIYRILIYIYAVAAPTYFVLNYLNIPYDPIYFFVSLLLLPIQIYVLVALFREKIPYSAFIIWGSLITIAGSLVALILTLIEKGAPPGHPIHDINIFLPVQLSIFIDMFLYSIALQKKIADTEKSLINAAYQRQQAVLLERERIIADLHDDVGGGLSSIRMMSDLMLHQGKLSQEQASFADKISYTARDIAQRMHTIIWSLNEENDSLDNFVEYVRQYGLSFFEGSSIRFRFEVNVAPGKTDMLLGGSVRKNLFLIVKESLHNVLKHSGASEVTVHLVFDGKKLLLTIADNGKGFSMPQQGEHNGFGNGLRNMHKRAEEIGGQLSFSSQPSMMIQVSTPIH